MRLIENDDWDDEDNQQNSSGYVEFIEGGNASGWETPDMGFHQRAYESDELGDCIDFQLLSDQEDDQSPLPNNPFIEYEAVHSGSESDEEDCRSPSLFDTMLSVDDAPVSEEEETYNTMLNLPLRFDDETSLEQTTSEDGCPPIKKTRRAIIFDDSDSE